MSEIDNLINLAHTTFGLLKSSVLILREEFSKPKIVYMEIQTDNESEGYPFPCFSYDCNRCVTLNTAYTMSSNSCDVRCILGILNSRLGKYLTKLYVTQLQERQFRMLAQYVTKFPILKFNPENQAILSHLVKDVLDNKSAESERAIDEYVETLYGLSDSERAYIHQ